MFTAALLWRQPCCELNGKLYFIILAQDIFIVTRKSLSSLKRRQT